MYYLLFTGCFLISLLPLRVLYLLSDGVYFVLYYGVGYRKKVVAANLLQAFPEKSEDQRTALAKKFYRGLTDAMVETIKLMTMSPRALNRRFTADLSLLHTLEASGRGIQIHLGHYFNWESANLYMKLQTRLPFLVTYMPMSNKAADRLFRYLRTRFGSVMIPANDVLRAMHPWRETPYISVLVADQNPGKVRRAYWYPFMNKMTAFYKGPELSARRSDLTVVFGEIQKVKRGHYHIVLKLASEHPGEEPEGAVTRAFVEFLEKGILAQPENWVWSHRRWKHTWKGGNRKEGAQET